MDALLVLCALESYRVAHPLEYNLTKRKAESGRFEGVSQSSYALACNEEE